MWRQDVAPWLNMSFLHFREESSYNVHVAEIIARYVDVFSSSAPVASLDLVAFNKRSDQIILYINFQCWAKKTVFERWLSTSRKKCCFVNWYCVVPYAVHTLLCSEFLVYAPDWGRNSD